MYKAKHISFLAVLGLLLAAMLAVPAAAQEISVNSNAQFCFSAEDFSTQDSDDGIFLTAVPSPRIATVYYGNRALRAGDALPKEALNQLTLDTSCVTQQDTALEYYTVSSGKITGTKALKLSILPKKNSPPTAENSSFETYKNIANTGELKASDPEGSELTFTLVDEPKRGSVELHQDGTFTYTPKENKVGNDSFTFTVTDDAGNTSSVAKVSVKIKKPADKAVYADMSNDPDAFEAMWLKDQDIFTGSEIGGNLCFSPDEVVARVEFLVMVMKLMDADACESQVTTGFADEADTPVWLQPYIVSALGNGMISGTSSDDGVVFRPAAALTKAEAAVMLQNILHLPTSETAPVFSQSDDSAIPAWAAEAAAALSQAGVEVAVGSESDLVTRRDAARILYGVSQLMDEEARSAFYWAQ